MAEPQEEVKDEFQVIFSIRLVKINTFGKEYYKLEAEVKDSQNMVSVDYERNNPETCEIKDLLKNIAKYYNIYATAKNGKLIEGAREEVLKLLSVLIWAVFY
jgi:hypothetical protein